MSKTVLFQTIQFSISTQFSSIDKPLSCATSSRQSGPWSDGNERVLRIPQSSSITGASSSDCLVSYQDNRQRGSYPFAEMQLVYSIALADRATRTLIGGVLSLCREAVGVFYSPRQLGKYLLGFHVWVK